MNNSDETLEQSTKDNAILQAIAELSKKVDERIDDLSKEFNERIDNLEKRFDTFEASAEVQFEAIRQGIVDNRASFDRLEAIALDAKSVALITRSQLTILTEEVRAWSKEVQDLQVKI